MVVAGGKGRLETGSVRGREKWAAIDWLPASVVRHAPPRDDGAAHHRQARSEWRAVSGER